MIGPIFLSGQGACAADAVKIADAVEDAISPIMREYDIPGMAIAVTVDGKDHFINYGVAARDTGQPVTPDTLFELGSVSKVFTATLVSYAQVTGKLSLADHPGKYMPQLQNTPVDEATLLNLGTYTAGGLPLQFPDDVRSSADMIAYFRNWQPEAAVGVSRRYSNPSIGLLGHVTGLALGIGFESALTSELLPRIGLNRTYVDVPGTEQPTYAWGYDKVNKPVRVNPGLFDTEAYGVKSSSADMIKFVRANIQPETLGSDVRRAVEGTHVGYFKVGGMIQGLGWEQYPYPVPLKQLLAGNDQSIIMDANPATPLASARSPESGVLYNKTGSTNGFGAYVAFAPEARIGIVMLANRNYPIAARVRAAHTILEALATKTD